MCIFAYKSTMISGWIVLLIFIVLVFLAIVVYQATIYAKTNDKEGAYERGTGVMDRPMVSCHRMVVSIDGWEPSMDLISKTFARQHRALGEMAQAARSFPIIESGPPSAAQLPATEQIRQITIDAMSKLQNLKQKCVESLGRINSISKGIANINAVPSQPPAEGALDVLKNSLNSETLRFRTLLVDALDQTAEASNQIGHNISVMQLYKPPFSEKVKEFITIRDTLLESLMFASFPDDIIAGPFQPYGSYDDFFDEYRIFIRKRGLLKDDSEFKGYHPLTSNLMGNASEWTFARTYSTAIWALQLHNQILKYLLPYTIVPAGTQISANKYMYIECACELATMLAGMAISLVKTYHEKMSEI